MNGELRRAIYVKRKLRNSFFKYRTDKNWEKYRKQRNLVTKLKRNSMQIYFFERCGGGPKSKHFWPTIKPFLSSKNTAKNDAQIILNENDTLITDQNKVCNILNDFYVNIAQNIGINSDIMINEQHPSVQAISDKIQSNNIILCLNLLHLRKCISFCTVWMVRRPQVLITYLQKL